VNSRGASEKYVASGKDLSKNNIKIKKETNNKQRMRSLDFLNINLLELT
jgi:hypothetical protein